MNKQNKQSHCLICTAKLSYLELSLQDELVVELSGASGHGCLDWRQGEDTLLLQVFLSTVITVSILFQLIPQKDAFNKLKSNKKKLLYSTFLNTLQGLF